MKKGTEGRDTDSENDEGNGISSWLKSRETMIQWTEGVHKHMALAICTVFYSMIQAPELIANYSNDPSVDFCM